ncbi:hypothetical protein GN244_ATG12832 [Phytophthora infestans]|uniref:Uncharacterized protein n=1 Tax=Phytophthora infestans TaxID=4787 RepID=A0A833SYW4_PHYIN|nr:hypothetical protein GN244_ATG12832 [Phytophthora infestans]
MEDEEKMREEAEISASARRGDAIRPWTQRENAIFIKYLSGDLDLQHPPNFIKEIRVNEHRVMVERLILMKLAPPSYRRPCDCQLTPHM